MTTKTDYTELNDLLDRFHPKRFGVLFPQEQKMVEQTLELKERTVIELHNVRDMATMLYSIHMDAAKADMNTELAISLADAMSAVTGVIDGELANRGSII